MPCVPQAAGSLSVWMQSFQARWGGFGKGHQVKYDPELGEWEGPLLSSPTSSLSPPRSVRTPLVQKSFFIDIRLTLLLSQKP